MTAAIDKKLYASIEKLNTAQKKSVLGYIEKILPAEKEELYTLEQYNKELEDAEAEIARGEFYTHEEAIAEFNKHLSGKK